MKLFIRILSLTLVSLSFQLSAQAVTVRQVSVDGMAETKDQYLSYYFGRVPVGQRTTVTYSLSNDSDKPLELKRITLSGMSFDQVNNCPSVIPARKSCLTRIAFWPMLVGIFTGRLVWELGDGNIILNLWGDGVQY